MPSASDAEETPRLADLEVGREAELREFLAERLERRCRPLGLEPGVTVRCRSRETGEMELALPDAEIGRDTVWVSEAVARQVRVEPRPAPSEDPSGGRRWGTRRGPLRSGRDEPIPFLEQLFRGGTKAT